MGIKVQRAIRYCDRAQLDGMWAQSCASTSNGGAARALVGTAGALIGGAAEAFIVGAAEVLVVGAAKALTVGAA